MAPPLLLLLAEQAEAFLLVLVPLPRTGLGGERHAGRQRLSAVGGRRAGVAALELGAIRGTGVQDGLDPGAHLVLQGATEANYDCQRKSPRYREVLRTKFKSRTKNSVGSGNPVSLRWTFLF